LTFTGKTITIPPGFISDGMSVPEFLWPFISHKINSKTIKESIIHDWLFAAEKGFWRSNWWYFRALKRKTIIFK
jgi:hypothetical protein